MSSEKLMRRQVSCYITIILKVIILIKTNETRNDKMGLYKIKSPIFVLLCILCFQSQLLRFVPKDVVIKIKINLLL